MILPKTIQKQEGEQDKNRNERVDREHHKKYTFRGKRR